MTGMARKPTRYPTKAQLTELLDESQKTVRSQRELIAAQERHIVRQLREICAHHQIDLPDMGPIRVQ
jgi:hypothetical protein